MGKILEMAEALWTGQTDTYAHHPLAMDDEIEQIADRTWFYKGFSCMVFAETDEGLILVDPGGYYKTIGPDGSKGIDSDRKFDAVRSATPARLHTAIYTHAHTDHMFGVPRFVAECEAKGWLRPQVIGHEAVLGRLQRYRETAGWNSAINSRQFQGGDRRRPWPLDYFPPNVTYSNRLDIEVGGVKALLRHARGETDDHTWVFFPRTGVLCPGDLFFWCVPNAGNPQKVQRYAIEWARALREMVALEPKILAPGHGYPIFGADRVRQALEDTAALLESLHGQTLDLMNQGAPLDTVIHTVTAPEHLLERPYLHPVYDEPEFIVRNVWRLYGGWYDGTPSHLKPAPEKAQADEIARLAGGAAKLAARAEELAAEGELRLACHLAEWAYRAQPDDPAVQKAARQVFTARAKAETSTMSRGIFVSAAREMGGGEVDDSVQMTMGVLGQRSGDT